ncbi:MAG: 3-deoxy-manno-octulosonate cytidylyltransferase [Candidatus Cloacimonetes bacterium]|nr:3-deoxy-manno-octulosonate cytidylyltransferase [Candidatus Cloacimonadota bacterium]
MKTAAVIPARFASTRFPGKPLVPLAGKPIIQHVYEAAINSRLFDTVLVATDSEEIWKAVSYFGGKAVMTSEKNHSGSDRIAEAIKEIDCDLIVNIQGDEPLIDRASLSALINSFRHKDVMVASLMTLIREPEQLFMPNIVKVVVDKDSNALLFSRSAIPFNRDDLKNVRYYRHIGVYAYRRKILLKFVSLPPGKLENIEKLEQLRLLENGIPIRMIETDYQGIGIDTPEDLILVEKLFKGSPT